MTKFRVNPLFYITFITLLISPFQKYVVYALLSIFVHELGHYTIIFILKRRVEKVEVTPIGCYFILEVEKDESLKDKLLIYSFGIIGNLVLIFISIIIKNDVLLKMNVGMLLFNIMPIPPLDGYHFLLYLFSVKLPYKKALTYANRTAFFFLIGFSVSVFLADSGFLLLIYSMYFSFLLINRIKALEVEYSMFLLRKHCHPNNELPLYRNNNIAIPLENNFLFGKRNVFIVDTIIVEEAKILKNKYKIM